MGRRVLLLKRYPWFRSMTDLWRVSGKWQLALSVQIYDLVDLD